MNFSKDHKEENYNSNSNKIIKNQISVFPNPTSDKINVTINSEFSQEFTISMSDMTGKSIYNQNFKNKNELIIDAKNFAKGTYVLIL